ncbi:hypothetical protein [Streptomyces sp. NPDC048277]
MDDDQETTGTKTAGAAVVGPTGEASTLPMDAEDEFALEPHIVRGLD